MKRIFFLILICSALNSSAQLALKVLQLRPTGNFGFIMKKAITGELIYMPEFKEVMRLRAGLCYAVMKPRLDTFFVTGAMYDGSNLTVLEGYVTYQKFHYMYLSGGMDFNVLKSKKFFLYPGFDIVLGGTDLEYDSYTAKIIRESFMGGKFFGGIKLRAGMEYKLSNKIGAFLEVTRSYLLQEGPATLTNNDIGLGLNILYN